MTGDEWMEPREGMATVYDDKGRYVGCIGIEFWRWLLGRDERRIMAQYDERYSAEERTLVEKALKELRSMEGSRVVAIGYLEYLLDPDPERFWPMRADKPFPDEQVFSR
jgi:hypothetical protein